MKRIFARGGIEFIAVLLGFSLSLYFDNLNEINQKKENEKNFTNLIRREMTSVKDSDLHSFSTPLTVDVNSGENWGLLH